MADRADGPTRGGRGKSAFLAGLFCAHCTVTGALAVLALATASLPTVMGVPLEWAIPPFFIFGLFALWLWSGREPRSSRGADVDPTRQPGETQP